MSILEFSFEQINGLKQKHCQLFYNFVFECEKVTYVKDDEVFEKILNANSTRKKQPFSKIVIVNHNFKVNNVFYKHRSIVGELR